MNKIKYNEVEFNFVVKLKIDDYLPLEKSIDQATKQFKELLSENIVFYDQNGAEYICPKGKIIGWFAKASMKQGINR